jgi:TRAP-type C4-dicarboxylate transport system permease small subunit
VRRAAPLLFSSGVLSALALLLTIWATWDWLAIAMLWGAPAVALVWALVEWRAGPPVQRARPARDVSLPTLIFALGAVGLLLGAVVGLWAALVGAGLVLAGVAGIAHERRPG